jgi:hypothetical protein
MSQTHPHPQPRFDRPNRFQSVISGHADEDLPFPEPRGASLVSLLAAGVVSFFFLVFAFFAVVPLFFELIDGDAIGPLILPIYLFNHYVEALIGAMIFTVIGAALVMLERARPFPRWLPQAISLPVAWALILPSRLEFGGSWLSWLIFGAIAAGTFCVYWHALTWARGIWD